jgi:hypothetical protein
VADLSVLFSPRWRALCREAGIASQSLSEGLRELRKANYAQTGLYSHAFLSLSIGFERILKLIYIIDYALRHAGTYPTERELKNQCNHDLERLFNYALSVHRRLPGGDKRYELPSDGIENDILKFLTKFAQTARYYNLTYLVGGKGVEHATDPIAEWFDVIGTKILNVHYLNRQKFKDRIFAEEMGGIVGPYMFARQTAEDSSPLLSFEPGALQTSKNKVIQKYGTFYCAKIARFLFMVLYDLGSEAHRNSLEIPELWEFFFPFIDKEDAYLLSRKTFPPPGQG